MISSSTPIATAADGKTLSSPRTPAVDEADTQTEPHDLADELRVAVLRLARRIRTETDAELSNSQYSVLAYLVREGPGTLSELSEFERVKPPSMNRTVNNLVAAGYVNRTTSDEDRRKVWFAATEQGHQVVLRTRARRDSWLDERLGELSPHARKQLATAAGILAKLAES